MTLEIFGRKGLRKKLGSIVDGSNVFYLDVAGVDELANFEIATLDVASAYAGFSFLREQ